MKELIAAIHALIEGDRAEAWRYPTVWKPLIARLIAALEAAEAENAELRARVAELEGRVPSDHRIRLFINSLRYYMRAAPYDSGDPYKNLEFLESVDAAAEWLETLPAAPVSPNGETEEV
jgi:hypothetical protein